MTRRPRLLPILALLLATLLALAAAAPGAEAAGAVRWQFDTGG